MKNRKLVYIHNYLQAMLYIKHGLKPVDVLYRDAKEGYPNDKIIFVFDKDKSKPLYEKFKKHELF